VALVNAMQVLGVITARGGSRGLPGKNIADVAGKPLIGWTIAAARAARGLTRSIVSTDSAAIAAVARQCGAEVPFLRPPELARDETPHLPVLLHALDWMRDHAGFDADYVMLLQPTSPLRNAADIEESLALAARHGAESVVAMVEPHGHPYWCKTLAPDGRVVPLLPPYAGSLRRQDLPPALLPNGALYLVRTDFLRRTGGFYGERTYAYVMPPERSLDVDTAWELELVRLVMAPREAHAAH
jgi:CMP-N,N'-diacetyllegionaminic acid synthase